MQDLRKSKSEFDERASAEMDRHLETSDFKISILNMREPLTTIA
jgi:hypothetical protein